ncbi:MAG: carbohydrate ABC transporter permease [Chloroflexi bacterium]|nr:MAG: carbohydrate ABC transporter permease [Chloroflexota bacterium]RLC85201.1 MAG: carbohydrate ABC transporter permease [Chloroflexota bacterium]
MTTTTAIHSTGYRVRKGLRIGFTYLLMSLLAIFFLFPIVFMLVSSIKNNETQVMSDMSTLYAFVPRGELGLQNYYDVFAQLDFGHLMFNSVLIVAVMVILGLAINSLMAYALARLRFRGRELLLAVVVALIIIPFESVAVPLLLLVNRLPWFGGATTWLDTYHVQIIPFVADAFSIFLFYQFFIGLPKDLEEAALVDGASLFRIFWNIVLPLSRPVFATVAILQFLTHWGDFLWPLMVTRGPEVRPLMIGMQQFFGLDPKIWGDIMAFASMITIPVLVVFLLFQKWFVQSVASTGIKG